MNLANTALSYRHHRLLSICHTDDLPQQNFELAYWVEKDLSFTIGITQPCGETLWLKSRLAQCDYEQTKEQIEANIGFFCLVPKLSPAKIKQLLKKEIFSFIYYSCQLEAPV